MNQTNSRVAVVTGSSSGIGKAVALELAAQDFDIVLHGRGDSQAIRATAQQIGQLGRQVEFVFGDFADDLDWQAFVDDAWSKLGPVDAWVNNAGGDVLTGDWPAQNFATKLEYLLKTDVVSTLMLSRLVGQKMSDDFAPANTDQCGSIVNIGWDQAWQGMAGSSGELFATTKGGIMSMTKSLAQSLAPRVRVNCIAPGWIKTKWGNQTSEYWNQRAKNESLLQRWGRPEDIANVAAFLCSTGATFVNGQIIAVNGGFRFAGTQ